MAHPLLDGFAKTFASALEKVFVTRDEKRAFGYPWADAEDDPRFSAWRQGRWFANPGALGPITVIFGDHLRDGWPHALEWVIGAGLLTQDNLESFLGEMQCCSGPAAMVLIRNFRLTPGAALLIAGKARSGWKVDMVLEFARAAPKGEGEIALHILRLALAAVDADVITWITWLLKCGNVDRASLGRMRLPYLSAVAERLGAQRSPDSYYTDRRLTGENLTQFLAKADKELGLVGEFLDGPAGGDAAEPRCAGDWDKVIAAVRKKNGHRS